MSQSSKTYPACNTHQKQQYIVDSKMSMFHMTISKEKVVLKDRLVWIRKNGNIQRFTAVFKEGDTEKKIIKNNVAANNYSHIVIEMRLREIIKR